MSCLKVQQIPCLNRVMSGVYVHVLIYMGVVVIKMNKLIHVTESHEGS